MHKLSLKSLTFTQKMPGKNLNAMCYTLAKPAICAPLQVHGTNMSHVTEDTYLGDVISNDGRNTKNINNRIGKGLGKNNKIMNMLEKVSLGQEYLKIAVLLRETIFLN